MRSISRTLPWLLGAFVTLACAPAIEYTPLNASRPAMAPRSPESVEVLTSGAPSRPHVDVALIQVEDPPLGVDTSTLLQLLRERAARAGCDALVITNVLALEQDRRAIYGTCVRYEAS